MDTAAELTDPLFHISKCARCKTPTVPYDQRPWRNGYEYYYQCASKRCQGMWIKQWLPGEGYQ